MILKDYCSNRILSFGKERGIIAFGAGRQFNYFLEYREELEDCVIGVIDNDKNKQGGKRVYRNREYPIWGIERLLNWKDIPPLVMITTSYEYEVFLQMNKYQQLNNWECGCYFLMIEKDNDINDKDTVYPVFHNKQTEIIPKKIHYCWFGENSLSERAQRCIESWKKYCPEYEIIRWDENNYNVNLREYTKQAYQKKKWAFVSDVARFDIIYDNGGVYFDTDVELIKNIDPVLCNRAFFALETNRYVATGLGFGAEKNSAIIRELLSIYDDKVFIRNDGEIDDTSCPVLQESVFKKHGYSGDGNYFETDDFVVYPRRMFAPKSFLTGKTIINDYTFAIHHFDMSWYKDEKRIHTFNRYKLASMAID